MSLLSAWFHLHDNQTIARGRVAHDFEISCKCLRLCRNMLCFGLANRLKTRLVAHHGDDPVFWQVNEKGRHGYKGGVDLDIGHSVQ